jgi:cell division transport system permease protein
MKENIGVTLLLKDGAQEADILRLQKSLEATNYIKSTRFVDKESAALELKSELGEDFIDFLGYNPLLSSIDVTVYAGYANPDSLVRVEKKLLVYPEIQEVYYQRSLVNQLNSNVQKISYIILAISLIMFIIFTALINNTIRLSVYSKRFLINTMQLVGATRSFIRGPFLAKSALHGIYGGLIACSMFLAIFLIYQKELKSFAEFQNLTSLALLGGGIFILGILITVVSTYLAVNKFLRMKFDQLFY